MMIGHIKNQIIHAIRGTNKRWWEVVDAVVKDYNKNHVCRNAQMTPKDAEKKENQTEVKTQLESIRKTDNPNLASPRGTRSGSSSRRSSGRAACRTPFRAYQRVATKPLSRIYRISL